MDSNYDIEVNVNVDSSIIPFSVEPEDVIVDVAVPNTYEDDVGRAIEALQAAVATMDDTVERKVDDWGGELTASATTLPSGSPATVEFANKNFDFGIPKGDKGDKGDDAEIDYITNEDIEEMLN